MGRRTGALEVRDEQRAVVIPGKMRTTLLAALVCRAPRVVPAHQLVEDLWGLTPPPSADKTLQSHLVRLRQDLGPLGATCILTSGPGYRIDLTKVDVDALVSAMLSPRPGFAGRVRADGHGGPAG